MNDDTPTPLPASDDDTTLQLWIFRLLFRLGTHKQFISAQGISHPGLAEYLKIAHLQELDFTHQLQQSILSDLRCRHAELEKSRFSKAPSRFQHAVTTLAERIGLSVIESTLLEFTVQLHQEQLLDEMAEWLGLMTAANVYRTLATLLDLNENDVRHALSGESLLLQTGLIGLESSGAFSLRNKLEILSLRFCERLYAGETEPDRLLQGIITPCDPAHLDFTDYPHIPALNILRQWLHFALQSRRKGVNILVYGAPGTGKSQLCRLLAEEMQSVLYEVSSENANQHPLSGSRRLRAWRAAQRFFSNENAVVLLDEAEDVFTETTGMLSTASIAVPKSWINRLMEENAVPTLWVSNDISAMAPAIIRRFDIVIELTSPPKSQREALLQDACGTVLTADEISLLASTPRLTPAVMQRTGNIISTLSTNRVIAKPNHSLMHLINNTLKAQGHAPIRATKKILIPALYDAAFINSDKPLSKIAAQLSPTDSACFCLYGPAGTGKTAWAYWLAEQLKMPVLAKRASHLFGRYVGDNEHNIATMFEQARNDNALLLIDEIDTFLTARESSQQSWESSCVNEMLSQMEHFDGIVITTTNRFEVLDAAALRRFDLKARFNYLCDYQAMALLTLYCSTLGLGEASPSAINALSRLSSLTPGDFFVVSRQHYLHPLTSADEFVTALKTECWLKQKEKTATGFLH